MWIYLAKNRKIHIFTDGNQQNKREENQKIIFSFCCHITQPQQLSTDFLNWSNNFSQGPHSPILKQKWASLWVPLVLGPGTTYLTPPPLLDGPAQP